MSKELEIQHEEDKLIQAASAETARGWAIGVAVLLDNGKVITRGYMRQGWAFKWANTVMEYGKGMMGHIHDSREGDYWRFRVSEGWEAF